MEEIDKLFSFIIHWDYHFKGDKESFRKFQLDNFDKIKQDKIHEVYQHIYDSYSGAGLSTYSQP